MAKLSSRDVGSEVSRALRQAAKSGLGTSTLKRMTVTGAATSSAAGVITFSFPSSLVQSNPFTEWNTFSARYLDYRVLRLKVTYSPLYVVNTSFTAATGNAGPIIMWSDPSGQLSGPVTPAGAWAVEGAKIFSLYKQWSYVMQASQREHLLFTMIGTPIVAANRFQMGGFATGLTISTTFGTFYYEAIVELRGSQ